MGWGKGAVARWQRFVGCAVWAFDYRAQDPTGRVIKQAWCSALEWMSVIPRGTFQPGRRCNWNAMTTQQVLERAETISEGTYKAPAVSAILAVAELTRLA